MLFSYYDILKMGKRQKESYNDIDEIIDYVMNDESDDADGDIDLGESDCERESSDSEILDYESEDIDITNDLDILTNSGTVEFQNLPSFATEDAQYEPVHHPQLSTSTLVSNSNPVPQPLAEITSSTTSNPVPPPVAKIMSSVEWPESSTTSDESENNSDKGPSVIKRKCKTRGGLQHKHQGRTRGGIKTRGAANILDSNIVDNYVRKFRGRGQPTVRPQIRSKQRHGV